MQLSTSLYGLLFGLYVYVNVIFGFCIYREEPEWEEKGERRKKAYPNEVKQKERVLLKVGKENGSVVVLLWFCCGFEGVFI